MRPIPIIFNERKGLIFGLLFYFVSRIPFLGLFSPAILVFAFYRFGRATLIKTLIVLMTMILVSDVFFLSRRTANLSKESQEMTTQSRQDQSADTDLSSPSNEADQFIELGNVFNAAIHEVYQSKLYFIFSSLWFILNLCGIYIFIARSNWNWVKRVCWSLILSSTGAYVVSRYVFSLDSVRMLFVKLNLDANLDSALSLILPVFIPLEVAALLFLNFFIAIMVLSRSSHITFSQYCEYLYAKLFKERHYNLYNGTLRGGKNIGIVVLVLSLILSVAILVNSPSTTSSVLAGFLLLLCVSTLIPLIILGVIRLYYMIKKRLQIDAGWYFITIFIIMLLPVLNIIVLLLCIQQGVISKFFDVHKGETNENNS